MNAVQREKKSNKYLVVQMAKRNNSILVRVGYSK